MELKEAVTEFKAAIAAVKKEGKSTVEITNLENYLAFLESQAAVSAQLRDHAHESSLAQYNAITALNVEMFRSVMDAGKEAINAAILINGGAVIALMAFVGNAAGKGSRAVVVAMALPMLIFGYGALSGGSAFGFRYIAQFLYAGAGFGESKALRITGHVFNAGAWVATLSAFLGFAAAVFIGYQHLSQIP